MGLWKKTIVLIWETCILGIRNPFILVPGQPSSRSPECRNLFIPVPRHHQPRPWSSSTMSTSIPVPGLIHPSHWAPSCPVPGKPSPTFFHLLYLLQSPPYSAKVTFAGCTFLTFLSSPAPPSYTCSTFLHHPKPTPPSFDGRVQLVRVAKPCLQAL